MNLWKFLTIVSVGFASHFLSIYITDIIAPTGNGTWEKIQWLFTSFGLFFVFLAAGVLVVEKVTEQ